MPPIVVGLMLGAGAAAWVYSKVMRSTGGNIQNSLVVAGIAGVAAMILIMALLNALS